MEMLWSKGRDGPVEQILDFNYQAFAENIEIVQGQTETWP